MILFCGGSIHLSPRWGLGVGWFDAFLYTYRPSGALRLVLPRLRYTLRSAPMLQSGFKATCFSILDCSTKLVSFRVTLHTPKYKLCCRWAFQFSRDPIISYVKFGTACIKNVSFLWRWNYKLNDP